MPCPAVGETALHPQRRNKRGPPRSWQRVARQAWQASANCKATLAIRRRIGFPVMRKQLVDATVQLRVQSGQDIVDVGKELFF